MTGRQLRLWRSRMRYTPRQAAVALGCSPTSIYTWEKQKKVPRVVELACKHLERARREEAKATVLTVQKRRGFPKTLVDAKGAEITAGDLREGALYLIQFD